jgi:hypothetical protein
MKKKLYWGGLLSVLALLYIFKLLFESNSVQYPIARRALFADDHISAVMGKLHSASLIGYSFRGGPEWGCATLTFLAFGDKQYGWVSVRLRRKSSHEANWIHYGSTVGAEDFHIDCRTGEELG